MELTDSQRKTFESCWSHLEEVADWLSLTYPPSLDDHRIPMDAPALLRDWLWVESTLTKTSLEEKLRGFAKSREWGDLTAAERFYLGHRLKVAKLVVEAILSDSAREKLALIQRWPSNFDDPCEMDLWLLVEVWNVFEEGYLAGFVEWFLAGVTVDEEAQTWRWNPPPPSNG